MKKFWREVWSIVTRSHPVYRGRDVLAAAAGRTPSTGYRWPSAPHDGIPMDEGGELEDITIRTRKPDKWRFHDTETGQVWRWEGGRFVLDHESAVLHLRTCTTCGQEITPKYIHIYGADHPPTVGPIRP